MTDTSDKGNNGNKQPAEFDAEAWYKELWRLNPWAEKIYKRIDVLIAEGRWTGEGTDDARNRETKSLQDRASDEHLLATRKRWKAKGDKSGEAKQRWNDWANGMLALRQQLVDAGHWNESRRRNSALQHRFQFIAHTKFSDSSSLDNADFSELIFPGDAWFENINFRGSVSFRWAEFKAAARFRGARFTAFNNSTKSACFRFARFHTIADFEQCTISMPISFSISSFAGEANFNSLRSTSEFSLADCTFAEVPNLMASSFEQPPRLDNVDIKDPVRRFHDDGGLAFDPRPRDSWWAQRLGVANMAICRDRDDEAKYRTLRQLAIEAQDSERELEFHAQEIRCRRFWRYRPWGRFVLEVREKVKVESPGGYPKAKKIRQILVDVIEFQGYQPEAETKAEHPSGYTEQSQTIYKQIQHAGTTRFWFGWLYEKTSNFGRSLKRPLLLWLLFSALFTPFYLAFRELPENVRSKRATEFTKSTHTCPNSNATRNIGEAPWKAIWRYACPTVEYATRSTHAFFSPAPCLGKRKDGSPIAEAFALSFKNAMVLGNLGRPESTRRTLNCLYGPSSPKSIFPHVPIAVSFISVLHSLLSLILIFLFLLALRNMLKLK